MGFNALLKLTKGPSNGLDMGADLSPSLVLWDKIHIAEEFAVGWKQEGVQDVKVPLRNEPMT